MENKICPACGGENIALNQKDQILEEPFGGQQVIKINEYTCADCGSSGDFFNENGMVIHDNLIALKNKAVVNILEDFIQKKISLSSMERALELPQRTLTKWKNNLVNPSSASIALLKFLRLFPWLLEVAEKKYDYDAAQKIQLSVAFQKMLNQMSFNRNGHKEIGIVTTAKSVFVYLCLGEDEVRNIDNEGIYPKSNIPEVSFS